jgi:PIN domain nuclease of toxin-antitoxin system
MSVVLDASALLALLNSESGADVVAGVLSDAAVSAVNLSEVVAKLSEGGMPEEAITEALDDLELFVVAFDADQAFAAGMLRPLTRSRGLSLGDRACLALGVRLGYGVLTADRLWATLDLGVEVRLVR